MTHSLAIRAVLKLSPRLRLKLELEIGPKPKMDDRVGHVQGGFKDPTLSTDSIVLASANFDIPFGRRMGILLESFT